MPRGLHLTGFYILPMLLIPVFFVSFIHGALWYIPDGDDVYFLGVLKARGVWSGTAFFYEQVTGRWLGHILSFINFKILGTHIRYYWIVILIMMLLFQASLALFLRTLAEKYYKYKVSFFTAIYAALIFTSCLYFFVYEGRWETWYWLSSVFIHPFGLTLIFLGFSGILRPGKSSGNYILGVASFLALGGIQEVYSVLSFLFFAWIYYSESKAERTLYVKKMLPAAIALTLSFLVNLLSSGFTTRIGNQPPFHVFQAIKNTVHSALIPVLNYEFVLPRAAALCIWLFWLYEWRFKISEDRKMFQGSVFGLFISLFLILITLFMTCYVLCDIAPQRCLIFPASVFLLTLSAGMLAYRKNTPLKSK